MVCGWKFGILNTNLEAVCLVVGLNITCCPYIALAIAGKVNDGNSTTAFVSKQHY